MPARREDEENLGKYITMANRFMNYEFKAIDDFEMLSKIRNKIIDSDIQVFISFFKTSGFVSKPKCLIELYNKSLECVNKYEPINVANIYEFTEFRFKQYYEILLDGGYLYEQEKNNSKKNIS